MENINEEVVEAAKSNTCGIVAAIGLGIVAGTAIAIILKRKHNSEHVEEEYVDVEVKEN